MNTPDEETVLKAMEDARLSLSNTSQGRAPPRKPCTGYWPFLIKQTLVALSIASNGADTHRRLQLTANGGEHRSYGVRDSIRKFS